MRANFARPLLAFLFAAVSLSAQTPTFKSRADLVQVPVIVHDRRGTAVSGLSSDEFVLQQDGKPQRIASIEEITSDTETIIAPAPPVPGVFTNRLASAQQPQRVIIFAIDLVNTPLLDVQTARKALLKFLVSQLKPDQAIGLVTIERGRVNLLHAFTTSPAVLSAALHKVTGSTMLQPTPKI